METNREEQLELEIQQLRKKQEHMARQIGMAVGLRYHLMPDVYPLFTDLSQIDIYADQIGIAKAGGDFFDMFRIDADHIGIVMADIFDGGDEAALYMVAFKLYLAGEVAMGFPPEKLMEVVNNRLSSYNEDNLCLSAFYGEYEVSTGILTAVNASGERPIILRGDVADFCEEDVQSYLMAVTEDMTYEQYQVQLEPGDTLLLYTDGAVKAQNGDGEAFGNERLMNALVKAKDNEADEIVGELQGELFEFIGETPLEDDASFLCLRREAQA